MEAEHVRQITQIAFRLLLACALGGIVGLEREKTNRPAGFRTHVLVCVGAALAMMTGEFVFISYGIGDPSRIGAQVVSGIGFLGAGTILRAGFNVRGLTTAASLWAVSCVGLACGIGFYAGAVMCAISITIVLVVFKRFERSGWERKSYKTITIATCNTESALHELSDLFTSSGVKVRNIQFAEPEEGITMLRIAVRMPNCDIPEFIGSMRMIPFVERATIE